MPFGVLKGNGKLIANKHHVAKNIVTRLKKKGYKVEASQEVVSLIRNIPTLKQLPDTFKFHTKPMEHQLIALRYAYTYERCGLLLDPGLGKTKIILDLISLLKTKAVIVCPKSLLGTWVRECIIHRPDLKIYVPSSATYQARWEALMNRPGPQGEEEIKEFEKKRKSLERMLAVENEAIKDVDVLVVNYDQAVDGWRWIRNEFNPNFMAIDEFLIKDPDSIRTKVLTMLGSSCKYRIGASGTLVNNSALDSFSPIRFLENTLVGDSYPKFRDRYCHMVDVKDPATGRVKHRFEGGVYDTDEIREILESCCLVMSKDKWLKDLPEKKFEVVNVPMTEYQESLYWDLARNYVCKVGDEFIEVDSPLTMMCKLSQISNGFIYKYNDDSLAELLPVETEAKPKKRRLKDRETIRLGEQNKITELHSLYLSTLKNKKFILWYNMSAELEVILDWLSNNSISFLCIKGGEKDTAGKVDSFNRDPTIQVLVCQARAVNYGITVLGTSYEKLESLDIEVLADVDPAVYTQVFFSIGYSLELFLQQQDRIHRIGQTNTCWYYILLSDNPTEKAIWEALSTKRLIREEMLVDWIHKLRGQMV